jgi:hypothetical protein
MLPLHRDGECTEKERLIVPATKPEQKLYFLTDSQYDFIKEVMKKEFGLDSLPFRKCIMDIAKFAHANGVEQTTKAIEDSATVPYPKLPTPPMVQSYAHKNGYYASVQMFLYGQAAVDAYIKHAGEPVRETALPSTKEEFVQLFEAVISEDPAAHGRVGETVYQVTKRELEMLYTVLAKKA